MAASSSDPAARTAKAMSDFIAEHGLEMGEDEDHQLVVEPGRRGAVATDESPDGNPALLLNFDIDNVRVRAWTAPFSVWLKGHEGDGSVQLIRAHLEGAGDGWELDVPGERFSPTDVGFIPGGPRAGVKDGQFVISLKNTTIGCEALLHDIAPDRDAPASLGLCFVHKERLYVRCAWIFLWHARGQEAKRRILRQFCRG